MISSNVSKRHKTGIYQARLRVPADLVKSFGRTELTHSLGTRDAKLAKKLARPVIATWEVEFEDRRSRRAITESDMNFAAADHYRRELEADSERRELTDYKTEEERARAELERRLQAGELQNSPKEALWIETLEVLAANGRRSYEQHQRRVRHHTLQRHLSEGEFALIEYAADEFIKRYKLTLERGTPAHRGLCQRLMRGEIEVLNRTFERDEGNFGGTPTDPLLKSLDANPFLNTTFKTVLDAQKALASKGIGSRKSAATFKKYEAQIRNFADWRKSVRMSTVTLEEAEQWRDHLLREGKRKTVRDKLATLKTVIKWGMKQSKGKLFPTGNPLDQLDRPAPERVDSSARTYSLKQAVAILRAARKRTEPHFRWIPWLAAYSGARVNELTALEKRDFFKIKGDWFFHIRVEGETRTTKTMTSRKVPVHPELVREGLTDFVSQAPKGALFTEGRVDQKLRNWIREDILKRKLGEQYPPPNHGFRHLFEDLRRFKLDQEAANYIMGRANPGSDSMYGNSDAMLPALAREMRKFPKLF